MDSDDNSREENIEESDEQVEDCEPEQSQEEEEEREQEETDEDGDNGQAEPKRHKIKLPHGSKPNLKAKLPTSKVSRAQNQAVARNKPKTLWQPSRAPNPHRAQAKPSLPQSKKRSNVKNAIPPKKLPADSSDDDFVENPKKKPQTINQLKQEFEEDLGPDAPEYATKLNKNLQSILEALCSRDKSQGNNELSFSHHTLQPAKKLGECRFWNACGGTIKEHIRNFFLRNIPRKVRFCCFVVWLFV